MKRKAVINPDTGEVENVIIASDDFAVPGHLLVDTDHAGPGWSYLDGVFHAPPAPPEEPPPPSEMDALLKALESKGFSITRDDLIEAKKRLNRDGQV